MSSESSKKDLELQNGRTVRITTGEDGETVEIRAHGGEVELRIKMTADGPVVQLQGARVEINATEAIQMQCKEFTVTASEKLTLDSKKQLAVRSTGKMDIEAKDDCVIRGKMIYLN